MTPTKIFIYLALTLGFAYALYFALPTQQAFWIVWSAFIFSLITLEQTFGRQLRFFALTVFICAISAFIAGFCAASIILLGIYLFLLTAIIVAFVEAHPDYSLLAFIIPIFAILGGGAHQTISAHFAKLFLILGGGAIAMFAQFVFLHKFKINEVRFWVLIALDHLKHLSNEIFLCFQPGYANNVYLFERRIHIQKMNFMRAVIKVKEFKQNTLNLEGLYIILLDSAQLRKRISDPTTFSLCAIELNELLEEINHLFSQLRNAANNQEIIFNTELFSQKITRFDEIYHSVLQVSAREPSVFIFFIESMKKLAKEMQTFYDGLQVSQHETYKLV